MRVQIKELPVTEHPAEPVRPAHPARSYRGPKASVREAGWGFFLISPWIVGLVVFTAIPILASLALSFTNYDILHPEKLRWVGLANYAWAASDPTTVSSAFLTIKFAVVSVPLTIVTALAIAMLINHRLLAGKRVFRTLFFLPVQIPVTASVFIWLGFLSGANRMPMAWLQSTSTHIAEALSQYPVFSTLAGVWPTGWFTDRSWTLPWLILMSVWSVGNMTLIFLAGLQAVPTRLYEAAKADGAHAWQTFRHVTLPMISPMVFYNIILSIIGVAGYFTQAFLWRSRGSGQNNVWNVNLYNTGWGDDAMGKACALAWILFVVVIAISVVLFVTAKRWVYYAGADAASSKAKSKAAEAEPEPLVPIEVEPQRPPIAIERPAPVVAVPAANGAPPSVIHQSTAVEDEPAAESEARRAAEATAARRELSKPRSRTNRLIRKLTARTAFTLMTAALSVIFLLPFLYALSAAFTAPGDGRGKPVYPAIARTYTCTDSQLCTYQPVHRIKGVGIVPDGPPVDASKQDDPTLPVYVVPGHGNLALLQDLELFAGQPSVFIDPATNKQVQVVVDDVGRLNRVWDFHISFDNFATAINWAGVFTHTGPGGIATWMLNSGIVSVLSALGATLSCVVVAYGFARFRFPGRDLLFIVLIGSVLIPYQVTLIPQFILYRTLGLTSSFLPLILPNFFGNALYIFLLRQFFMTLPRDLDEAAMVDGAGHLRVLRSIIVPQALPAIVAVALFQFFFSWNDFMGPLIYLSGNAAQYTLSFGVGFFMFDLPQGGTNGPGILQAGSLIVMIVPVAIFFLAQRFFLRGIVISGVEK
jgi:multiple sugar transport system permease protein